MLSKIPLAFERDEAFNAKMEVKRLSERKSGGGKWYTSAGGEFSKGFSTSQERMVGHEGEKSSGGGYQNKIGYAKIIGNPTNINGNGEVRENGRKGWR